jgi:hypothetical protein
MPRPDMGETAIEEEEEEEALLPNDRHTERHDDAIIPSSIMKVYACWSFISHFINSRAFGVLSITQMYGLIVTVTYLYPQTYLSLFLYKCHRHTTQAVRDCLDINIGIGNNWIIMES